LRGSPCRTNARSTRRDSYEEFLRFQQRQARADYEGRTGARRQGEITIRLDQDIVDHFLAKADESGGAAGYQTLINEALRRSIDAPSLEAIVRRAIREELKGKLDAA
jgi:uncharacterized protein (DUF4415 family)